MSIVATPIVDVNRGNVHSFKMNCGARMAFSRAAPAAAPAAALLRGHFAQFEPAHSARRLLLREAGAMVVVRATHPEKRHARHQR